MLYVLQPHSELLVPLFTDRHPTDDLQVAQVIVSGRWHPMLFLHYMAYVLSLYKGIVFSLIIVRVGLGLSTDATTKNTRRRSFISTLRAVGGLPTPRGGVVSTFDGELDPVVVTITKATRSDGSRTVGEVELVDLPSKHVLGDK